MAARVISARRTRGAADQPIARVEVRRRAHSLAVASHYATASGDAAGARKPSPLPLAGGAGSEIAPVRRPLDAHCDDRISCNLHGAELRVAGAQQCLRIPVFLAI